MKIWKVPILSVAALSVCLATAQQPAPKPSLSQPAISPDGREIAFVSGGDIWAVPASGGDAHLLVSHPATESHPLYSPDGTELAFVSTRTGNGDIYVLTLATGQLRRMTYSDAPDDLDGWSPDGKWLYFTSAANDISRQDDVFRVSAEGGTPLEVSKERYLSEFESAPSPDGKSIVMMAKGLSDAQWWRNGHSHIDNTELWWKPIDGEAYRVLLPDDAKHGWPMWSSDGKTLYYMSDKTGPENLWSLPAGGGTEKQLTHFTDGRLLFPSIGAHGKAIVFERDLAIWKMDPESGRAEEVKIALRGSPAGAGVDHKTASEFSEMALSPDGKKVALVTHGDVYATTEKDGGDALRITHTPQVEFGLKWSPDSKHVVYQSMRNGHSNLFEYDFTTDAEKQLTKGTAEDEEPRWSPDGKTIAYARDHHEIHLLNVADGTDRVLATSPMWDPEIEFSPAGDWLAYTVYGYDAFRNIYVVPTAGGTPQPITFLANGQSARRIAWSPDGKYILFGTAQRSEMSDMARVDLTLHVPKYREDEFLDLFKTPPQPVTPKPGGPKQEDDKSSAEVASKTDAAKKPEPAKIVFDGIRDRLSLLPIGLSAVGPVISPDGKTLVFEARAGNQSNLYSYSLDEEAKEPAVAKQLTSDREDKSDVQFLPDSKSIVYLEGGHLHQLTLEDGKGKPIAVTATYDVDFNVEKNAVFNEAWEQLNLHFYDDHFHGQNWKAVHDEFAPYIAGVQTPDEMRRDISLMIGQLNSSHSGIYSPDRGSQQIGRLGLRFDRADFEAGRGLVVTEVVPLGPANIAGIEVGDKLLAVDGQSIGEHTNLDALLNDTIGRRTVLHVQTGTSPAKDVIVKPVNSATEAGLLYREWVEHNRALVYKLSGGKLGYVHMADMGDASLKRLYLDLDAQNQAKEGVVVDIRNNDGGYVNGYAIDVFARHNYLELTPRGLPTAPSRQILGQRALGKPTVLLTNESTLSDGEDFTEGYRSLHLGKVVGVPTAGWIIYTSGTELVDGSLLRLPQIRVQDMRGETMEMHPRPVDVEVVRAPGETETGHDAQLERAVQVLLQQVQAK